MELNQLEAALFTKTVKVGEINPDGEANYEGYSRVVFIADESKNLEHIEFPEAGADYKDAEGNWVEVMCVAAITTSGLVVGVLPLSS